MTDLHSENNNSDIPSEDELNCPSASRVTISTPGRKRKERSPQETNNNPQKKINMGHNTDEKRKLEQQLTEEEERDIDSLSPELAKVTKIQLQRNEHRFTELQNDISTLLMNSEVLQEQQNQIKMLKKENCDMQLRCDKLETDQRRLKKKLSQMENEILESTAIIQGIHEERWEEGSTRYNMVVDTLAYTMYGYNHHEQLATVRKILIKKNNTAWQIEPLQRQTHLCNLCLQ